MRGLIAALLLLGGPLLAQRSGPPYSPTDALKTFRLADDTLQIELFAAEPLISDPVAMEVDEYGRTYVVEMHGYPLDIGGSGRVMLLKDVNRDGLPDASSVFADGLRLPTGVMRWKNGVIVTDSPDVWYFEDTDGDGGADVKRTMLTGFALSNPQHTTNTPLYGLDNWIYIANEGPVRTVRYEALFGDEGRPVHFPDRPEGPRLPPDADGRNVRVKPDAFELEALSSRSQFGHTFDAWGHYFLNTNNRHIYQEVIAARYLARNPSLVVPSVVEQVPDYRLPAEVFPITENPKFELLTDVGVMTAASGLTYYLAHLLPPRYRSAAFVAEGAHNLVHVASLRDHGVTFRASRMFENREFLASTDPWFRPVNFYIGPDGALYLLDYYRKILEHPEWLDDETAKSQDVYAGRDRGRIYRIAPRGTPPPGWLGRVALGESSPAELVRRLADPNIWWRRHAQRLLVDRLPMEALPPLTDLATRGQSAVGRVHALWTLEGIRQLGHEVIERALRDEAAGVRENAIKLAETRASLEHALVAMKNDPDPKVRLQLLLTLGYFRTAAAENARDDLLIDNVEDEWMQVAALSTANRDPVKLFRIMLVSGLLERETPGRRALVSRIASMIGTTGRADAVSEVLGSFVDGSSPEGTWWHGAVLDGLASGLPANARQRREFDAHRALLAALVVGDGPVPVRRAALAVLEKIGLPRPDTDSGALDAAARLVGDASKDAEVRAIAIGLVALAGADKHEATLREVLTRAEPAPVQIAAVRALAGVKGPHAASLFVSLWDRWTPTVRDEAVRAMVREPAGIPILLDAVTIGKVRPTEIERPLRIRLMMTPDPDLRARARALFAESATAPTASLSRYKAVTSLTGNRDRGRQVFERVCATCHTYRGSGGVSYGPDLGEVRNRLPMALLTDIVVPNHSVADGYELWLVQLTDGRSFGGIVGAETPTSITFRLPGGTETIVSRTQIASMKIADVSAMPEGLAAQIDLQQMADLIAFIKEG